MECISPTLQATLSLDNATLLVDSFIRNNGYCKFPCIWNFIPGKTQFNDANLILEKFKEISEPYINDSSSLVSFDVNENELEIIYDLSYIQENNILELLTVHAMGLHYIGDKTEGVDIFSDSENNPLLKSYQLSDILTNYGLPDRVLVGGFYDDRSVLSESNWEFSTILDYSKYGFFVEYLNFGNGIKDDILQGCPTSPYNLAVWSWNPERNYTLETALSNGAGGAGGITEMNTSWFRPIELVSQLTLPDFYEIYKEKNSISCFDTPIHFWTP